MLKVWHLTVEDGRIELVIEGLSEEGGRVRLSTFMSQLQHLSAVLSKLAKDANDGKQGSEFQIVGLSYASPYRVVLEPKPHPSRPFAGHQVVSRLVEVARSFESTESLIGMDADLLEDFKALAKPVGKDIKNTAIFFNGTVLDLTPKIALRVEEALAIDEECDGFIEGMLEQINLHHGANTFHIYPDVGPKKVTCHFPVVLIDEAIAAVGRRVEVIGSLKYRLGAPFPHQITVTGVEAIPSDYELPDWDDLRGRAPDATGQLSSEAFVRELRDAWL